MPQPGQKAVTVPEEIYDRVQAEVESGSEKSVAGVFIKAVNEYLSRKYVYADDLRWLKENRKELEDLLVLSRKSRRK
jgi:L-lactate utilization protein LutC